MKFKYASLYLFVFAIFAISFNAFAEKKAEKTKLSNSEKAKMILEKAKKTPVSFTSFSKEKIGKHTKETKRYVKVTPDGLRLTRTEFITIKPASGFKKQTVNVFDGVNHWVIFDDIAINEKYLVKDTQKILLDASLKKKQKLVYQLKKVKFHKIPCYEILETDISPSLPEKSVKVIKYIIGEQNYFIYSTEVFDGQGKRLSQITYDMDSLTLNPSIDDKLFAIPKECKVYTAETFDDFVRLRSICIDKQMFNDPKVGKMLKSHYEKKYGGKNIYNVLNEENSQTKSK